MRLTVLPKTFIGFAIAAVTLSALFISSTTNVSAHDNIDESGKVHLYWQGNYYVDNYVDYTKKLSEDKNSIEWTVYFNSAKEKWVYPDFSVFLPEGVEKPDSILVDDEWWGLTITRTITSTPWSYDWKTQKDQFNREWDKFPGYTGWSNSLDKLTKTRNEGGFAYVLVDTYGRNERVYFGQKRTWTFTTRLKDGYKDKWDKLPFVAGIKQNDSLAASYPSYKAEFKNY